MNNNYLIIDFDGVICDSTYECLVVSYNAWNNYNEIDSRKYKISDFDKEYINKFKKLRPFVKGAGEYLILFEIMNKENVNDYSLDLYNQVLSLKKNFLNRFKDIFLKERHILRNKNFNDWVNLHILYKDVLKFMEKYRNENKLFIATLKDAKSINILLDSVNFNFNVEKIFDSKKITSKINGLNLIREKYNINIKNMFFIDDNIDHLIKPHSFGYKTFLANWCNPLDDFSSKAKKNNITIINNIRECLAYV